MPWYRFSANHGPGHQSRSEEYRYFDKRIDKEEKEFQWNYIFDTFEYDWPIGNVTCVRKVPEAVRTNMIEDYKDKKAHAVKMLKVLQGK